MNKYRYNKNMEKLTHSKLLEAISHFEIDGNVINIEENHNGHINDTFVVTAENEEKKRTRYIVQRINSNVFPNVKNVMFNIQEVLSFMRKKVADNQGDLSKEVLTLIPTKNKASYFEDEEGSFFRAYLYLEDSLSYNQTTSPEVFGASGRAFGKFQRDLNGFDAAKLFEVIPNFHNTPKRYRDFLKALSLASEDRKEEAKEEIKWAKENQYISEFLSGKNIPLRVTHNDTKLNNVLFFEGSNKTCVIDLDTIMPGYSLYDFGDSIRFGANEAKEDEKDLNKVKLSLAFFKAYLDGYMEGAGETLTKEEIALFPEAGMLMTYECGIRFLTDFLNGDTYFKISYPNHNLVRAKDQFALVEDMKKKLPQMRELAKEYL